MSKKIIHVGRDQLRDLQDMMWTAGHIMTAIVNTRGIHEIEQTILRPIEGGDATADVTAFAIIVRPDSDFSVYKMARILRDKIKKAKKQYEYEYDRMWQAFVFVDYLTSESKEYGGVGTDIWGRPTVTIKITPYNRGA